MTTKEFELIYQKHWWAVFSYAKSRLTRFVDWYYAEEVTAQVFAKLWITQPKFENDKNIKSWLYTTASRKVIDMIRVEGHRHIEKLSVEEYMIPTNEDVEKAEIESEVISGVLAIIKQYSQREQQIFDLHYIKELPAGKIAEILKTKPQTVSNQLLTLKRKIKEAIKKSR